MVKSFNFLSIQMVRKILGHTDGLKIFVHLYGLKKYMFQKNHDLRDSIFWKNTKYKKYKRINKINTEQNTFFSWKKDVSAHYPWRRDICDWNHPFFTKKRTSLSVYQMQQLYEKKKIHLWGSFWGFTFFLQKKELVCTVL